MFHSNSLHIIIDDLWSVSIHDNQEQPMLQLTFICNRICCKYMQALEGDHTKDLGSWSWLLIINAKLLLVRTQTGFHVGGFGGGLVTHERSFAAAVIDYNVLSECKAES